MPQVSEELRQYSIFLKADKKVSRQAAKPLRIRPNQYFLCGFAPLRETGGLGHCLIGISPTVPLVFAARFARQLSSGRVRRFGWLHPAAKTRRERVELLLGKAEITLADTAADPPLDAVEEEPFPKPANLNDPVSTVSAIRKTFSCPRCAKPMCWIGSVWRGCAGRHPGPARAPPPKS